jgi:predicted nucleic acid-binding protein
MPLEVLRELQADKRDGASVEHLIRRAKVTIHDKVTRPTELLLNSLDLGEAAVIQLALSQEIPLVAIDERAGRRLARLCGLEVTGSLGILLRARKIEKVPSLRECIENMERAGIWLGVELKAEALRLAGEN